jgi:hypothetical protein
VHTTSNRGRANPLSAYTRYSWLHFSPDPAGDLLFNGIAQQATRWNAAYGVQADGSWRINEQHTLRARFIGQQAISTSMGWPSSSMRRRQARA